LKGLHVICIYSSLATKQTIMASYIYEIMRCLGLVAGMTCVGYGSDISQMKLDTLIISR
jgi:hypothetical protein